MIEHPDKKPEKYKEEATKKFQVLQDVYNFMRNEDCRALYYFGGKFEKDNLIINIWPRKSNDRKIYLTLWMDSHGLLHHHFPPAIQQFFGNQDKYVYHIHNVKQILQSFGFLG